MDVAYISGQPALAGSVVGGPTSGTATRLAQRAQARAECLVKWGTVSNLMGVLTGRSTFIEGLFAGIMCPTLRIMHQPALNGPACVPAACNWLVGRSAAGDVR